MNGIYERISEYLGSSYAVGLFSLWLIYHTASNKDYISFISELAILIGLLILRAENSQATRMERYIKEAKADVKKDLKKSDKVIQLIKRSK